MLLNNSLVSICIPVYNSSAFLRYTLHSVLSQTYDNIEVIICDDASIDNTLDIVESFKDHRIKLFKNPENLGVVRNWNYCISLANGEFVKMMGADDILYPDCIKEQVRVFLEEGNKDLALVIGARDIISPEGKVILKRSFPFFQGKILSKKAIRMNFWFGTNVIGEPVTGLFKSEFIKNGGRYNSENLYLIDLDFWCNVLQTGKLFVVDKTLCAFRISRNSLSSNLRFAQAKLYLKFAKKLLSEKHSPITPFHYLWGSAMTFIMQFVRKMFYFIYFKK